MIDILFLIGIQVIFFAIMKWVYGINPWEIKKQVSLWNKKFM